MWNSGWDNVFSQSEWGKYPSEDLVRFVERTFRGSKDRNCIRVLEVGCGPGANVLYFAREGFNIYGIDGSAQALRRCEQRLSLEGLSANLSKGDAMTLPYEDSSFDLVVDVECIYANDLNDSQAIIAECVRVLTPGGIMFSKTFMSNLSGTQSGEHLPQEPLTFTRLPDSPLRGDYGIVRLTSEDQIPILYGALERLVWDSVVRTDRDRTSTIGEWIISGRKPS